MSGCAEKIVERKTFHKKNERKNFHEWEKSVKCLINTHVGNTQAAKKRKFSYFTN